MTITINGLEISQSITSITKFQKEKVLFESTGDSVLWQLIKTPISNNDSTYYEKWANSGDIDSTLAPEELVLNIAGSYKIKIEETTSGVIRRHLVVIEAESLKDNTVLPFTGESTETNSTDGWSRKVEKSLQTLSQNEGSFSVVAIADTKGEEYTVGELAILSGLKYTKSSGFIYELEKPEGADPESRGYIGIVLDKKSTGGGITFDDDYSNIYNVAFKGAFKLTEELSPFGTTPLGMQMVYYDRKTFKLTKSPTDYYIGKYFYNKPEDIVLIIENPIFFNYKYSVLVTDWALPEPSHTNIPSEKLVKDNLDLKQDKHLVTDWTLPAPLHTNYPSELLVKTELDTKQTNNLITKWSTPDPSEEKYPSEALVLETFQQLSEKVVSWSANPTDDNYPSEKLVKNNLDILFNKIIEEDMSFVVDDEESFDILITFINNIIKNNYRISISGNYLGNDSKDIRIGGINGNGSIEFNLKNFQLKTIIIENCENAILFDDLETEFFFIRNCEIIGVSELLIYKNNTRVGLLLENSRLDCKNLTISYGHDLTIDNINDRLITLRFRSILTVTSVLSINAEYGANIGTNFASKYTIDIIDNSLLYSVNSNFETLGAILYGDDNSFAYIYTDSTSKFIPINAPIYDFNTYPALLHSENYEIDCVFEVNTENQVKNISTILGNIKFVNCVLSFDFNMNACNIVMSNIGGSGRIDFTNMDINCEYYVEISNCNPIINLNNIYVDYDSDFYMKDALKIIDCKKVYIDGVILNVVPETNAYGAIVLENCSGKIENVSVNATSIENTFSYIYLINSDFQMNTIDSSDIVDFIFIVNLSYSKLIVSNVTPHEDYGLIAKITEPSLLIYKNGTGTYVSATDPTTYYIN